MAIHEEASGRRRRRRALVVATLGLALGVVWVAPAVGATQPLPWELASNLRGVLAQAEKTLILEGPAQAGAELAQAEPFAAALAERLRSAAPVASTRIRTALRAARKSAERGDEAAFEAASADVTTGVLLGAYQALARSVLAGDVAEARSWLLIREFRKPTRFSRPGADATLAVAALADRSATPPEALASIDADLLDTYQARLLASLEAADEAMRRHFTARAAAETALARGYFAILESAYADQRGGAAARQLAAQFDQLAASAREHDAAAYGEARPVIDQALGAFRAAPLSAQEQQRRAGQFLRFLALVPVEYGRGVDDGHVTLDFEIQEAITFRDGAAQALGDLEYVLVKRDAKATTEMKDIVGKVGADLALAARGGNVADPEELKQLTDQALTLADATFPEEWKETSAADFDVIRASLDRVEGAVAAGEYAKAEQARLEAYAFFEFGPEQRLRGIAPDLFVATEGLFWYGSGDHAGLAQLLKRKSSPAEVASTRRALDDALTDAEAAVGAGPGSTLSVVTNTAIIMFREGLEAVLIVAALIAGMIGAQRRLRRPLLLGALAAIVASVATFVIAQTVLESLGRYGEKLEAVVSLVAIAVLLLILNWFFHKVYWSEHLADLHGRKKKILRAAGMSVATAQVVGLAALGFSAVYREGFETVLFLQAIVLETGVGPVLEGVLLGLAGVAAVGLLTIVLERKLPHRRMLELTGLLILLVLVVMVGKTVQVCQVVGWLPVHPLPGVRLPYTAGAWFGVFPTWEGVAAQAGATLIVLGSYVGAEWLRRRRRARIKLAVPLPEHDPRPEPIESPLRLEKVR